MIRRDTIRAPLLALGLLAALAPGLRAGEPVRLRVLSYNIHHGEGTDGRLDLDRIARAIRAAEPDIVALQEVDRGAARSEGLDEPAELARRTGLTALFGPNIPLQGGDYGNALLTRLPVRGHRNVPLPSRAAGEQRGVLVAELTAPDGKTPLRVLATHLDHRADDAERLDSARLIRGLVTDADPDRPTILMGDLNALPDSRVLAAFDASWTRANREPRPTFPAAAPTRQIDYVLVRPEVRWRAVEVRVPDEPVASDHRPILAILELLAPTAGAPTP